MNDEQFDLIVRQLQTSNQPALVAARLILVHGERVSDAMRETSCHAERLSHIVDLISAKYKVMHP